MIVFLTGPSGAGKGTIWNLYQSYEGNEKIEKVITCTTRPQREHEVEGVDYYFLDKETFQKKIEQGEMIEYAEVYGNLYGSGYQELERILNKGKLVLYEIDPQGVKSLQKTLSEKYETKSVFVLPPSLDDLEDRLKARDSETEEDFRIRIEQANEQIAERDIYDFNIVNDDLKKAVGEFQQIVDDFLGKIKQES